MKIRHFLKDTLFPEDWWKATLGLLALIGFLGFVLPAIITWIFGSPEVRRDNGAPERYEEYLR